MGRWLGTAVGFRVKRGDKARAERFLRCLDTDTEGESIYEPIGVLNRRTFRPNAVGVETGYGDVTWLVDWLADHSLQYRIECRWPGENDEEEGREEDENDPWRRPRFSPDELFQVANRIFPGTNVYIAQEDGGSVMDDFYRYEAVLDAVTGMKTELDCYYCAGEGINVKTRNPKKEGLRKTVSPISPGMPEAKILDRIIRKAEELGDVEMAEQLKQCL